MKKLLLVFALFATVASSAFAQRFVYVDMAYILENSPEYEQAQLQINTLAEQWSGEVEAKMTGVENAYKKFQAEQVLMTDQMKQTKIREIETLEKEAKELQKTKFGPEGELFTKRQELIKPIQDKIYEAIELLAKEKSYDFILDKSSGVQMLYASDKYDKSDDIIRALKN